MPVERREQVTRVEIVRVNGQPEELAGFGVRRQPSLGGTSRMNREIHVRICERLGVKFPGATRLPPSGPARKFTPPASSVQSSAQPETEGTRDLVPQEAVYRASLRTRSQADASNCQRAIKLTHYSPNTRFRSGMYWGPVVMMIARK